mgnify:CR=1 FL=1
MCIRDRLKAEVMAQVGEEDVVYVESVHQIARICEISGRLLIHFSNCLLYTSDAADERSSVDLGGRRIIKKKKKEEEEEEEKEKEKKKKKSTTRRREDVTNV